MVSMAQVNQQVGSAKGFSEKGLKYAKGNIESLNNVSAQKVALSLSLFYLDRVKKDPKAKTLAKGASLQDAIKPIVPQENSAEIEAAFNALQEKVDKRSQQFFDKLPGNANVLMVSLSVGIWHRSTDKDAKTASLYRLSIYNGSGIPKGWIDNMNDFIKNSTDKLDFDDPKFEKNDEFLKDMVNALSRVMFPAVFEYTDAGSKRTFDPNTEKECQTFPSFRTSPVSGMPWKCIPADNTFQPIQVEVKYGYQKGARFKVKDPAHFKLKSDTLDEKSRLWVSAGPNAKETAIVPVFNNGEYAVGGVNVVAYPKKVEKVAIVFLEDENDDVQEVPINTGGLDPNKVVVSSGKNGVLDTELKKVNLDDKVITDPVTKKKVIVAGPNGICDTNASSENIWSGVDDSEMQPLVAELTKQLNLLYGPVNIEWQIAMTKKKAINYDLNLNGIFDMDGLVPDAKVPGGWTVVTSDENDLLRADTKTYPGIPHVLYFIGSNYTKCPLGITIYPDNTSGIVYPIPNDETGAKVFPKAVDKITMMVSTSLHELGHTLGLGHTVSADVNNTMGAPFIPEDLILRKYQWDIMHGRLPRSTDLVTPQ